MSGPRKMDLYCRLEAIVGREIRLVVYRSKAEAEKDESYICAFKLSPEDLAELIVVQRVDVHKVDP